MTSELILIYFFVLVTGLCIGSFLNVVALRAFSGESIVLPPSKCPFCNTKIKWYHNIPVFSYLFLKGKCAYCNEKISPLYPITETLTGILFVSVFAKYGYNISTLFMWYFVSMFIVLAICDIKEKVIFDYHTYFLIIGGMLFNTLNINNLYSGSKSFVIAGHSLMLSNSFLASILGILAGFIIMEILAHAGYILAGTRAFGNGDSYIAAALGAIFGWKHLILVLFFSVIIQMIFTLPVFVKKLCENKSYKTVVELAVFFILAVTVKILEYTSFNKYLYIFCLSLLILSSVFLCKEIISNLKHAKQSNYLYMPFGPAMVIAATCYLLFV